MPKCRYCPKECGNDGALAQHERACSNNPQNAFPDSPQQTQQQPQQQNQLATTQQPQQNEQVPAQVQQQEQGGLPANKEEMANLAQQGQEIADVLTSINSDDPMDRSEAKMQAGGLAAGFVYRAFENSAAADRRRAQQRQQAEQNNSVQRADPDYCPECGAEILNPPDGQFACPGCGVALESAQRQWNGPSGDV